MKHIDLFSGIGGFALAAHWAGYQTEVFCEQNKFCQQVLNRHWPTVPLVSDIRDFDGGAYRGANLLTGGFPCQPFSTAGKRRGEADDRFLWPQMLRVISEARPSWIVAENVLGIIGMALDGVLADLEAEGYETGTLVIPACGVNAPHKRDRVWIVAHTHGNQHYRTNPGIVGEANDFQAVHRETDNAPWRISGANSIRLSDSADVADTHQSGLEGWKCASLRECSRQQFAWAINPYRSDRTDGWQPQSRMGDVADGLPGRLAGYFDSEPAHIPRIASGVPQRAARLKALGNAIVPQVAYEILRHISRIQPHP